MNWCILISLAVAVIAAILGYLLGKLSSKNIRKDEIVLLKNKIAKLESSLRNCKESKSVLETDLKLAKSSMASSIHEKQTSFNIDEVKKIFGRKIKKNDLKIVEGIGPKIEELFHNFSINSWKLLAETSVEKCQEVLKSGGDRYRVHKPNTWPKQAKLAYEGKWQELKNLQDNLDGKKEK
ncbi:hypothetical protein C7448_101327 [Tenacibaculum gallaicum]|uniref:Uncharacterized protein n=1 Tax=Tenacibaculum gallaicum TaxID=561505 RepID=A0A3E0ICE1_9FLAO|nr:hypothetical protein [Tenacibaculum gallaicum]REH56289.1 hypothetical protein C7448_101327 [Tenacibaculum gallaicum]